MCAQTLPRTVEEAFDRADARAVLPRDVGKRIDVEIEARKTPRSRGESVRR